MSAVRELIQSIQDSVDFVDPTGGATPPPMIRMAFIDPAYAGSGNPAVRFDFDDVVRQNTYRVLDSGYVPQPNDAVIMVLVNRTYCILGPIIDLSVSNPIVRNTTDWNTATVPGYLYVGAGLSSGPVSANTYAGIVFGDAAGSFTTQVLVRLTSTDVSEMWMRTRSNTSGWRGWRSLTQEFLGETVSSTPVTTTTIGGAAVFNGAGTVTFTLTAQTRVKVTVEGRYTLGTTSTGRALMWPAVSTGSTPQTTPDYQNTNNFASVYNSSGIASTNGSCSMTRTGTFVLPAGTYTAHAVFGVYNGGSTSDSMSAWHTLVEVVGAA